MIFKTEPGLQSPDTDTHRKVGFLLFRALIFVCAWYTCDMKIVIQRVTSASVTERTSGTVVGKINEGLFILVGFKKGDTETSVTTLTNKLLKLRIMSDDQDKMNLSIVDAKGSLLVVSQFTLYANTKDGNRPSFIDSLEPDKARELYSYFVSELKKSVPVEIGSFGNYMDIDAKLDGPVTITLES
jgi:D-tyrosyl-tRNA(Tyr) deacylase